MIETCAASAHFKSRWINVIIYHDIDVPLLRHLLQRQRSPDAAYELFLLYIIHHPVASSEAVGIFRYFLICQ